MKFNNIRVYNFEGALRGMRNPKDSWHLSDSEFGLNTYETIKNKIDHLYESADDRTRAYQDHILYSSNGFVEYVFIGPNDMRLAQILTKAGPEHRKFLRQIVVCMDITAPLYWWKEFDTYKVGTVANSTSTMHKLMSKPITLESFEIDDLDTSVLDMSRIQPIIDLMEELRQEYLSLDGFIRGCDDAEEIKILKKKLKAIWKELVRWLPESWLQTRTVTMNYENLLAMCSPGQRRFHKLNEWSGVDDMMLPNFVKTIRQLPYAWAFIFADELK